MCPDCGTDLSSTAGGSSPVPPPFFSNSFPPVPQPGDPAPVPPEAPAPPPVPPATPRPAAPMTGVLGAPPVPEAPPPPPVLPAATATLTLKRGGALTAEVFTLGERVVLGRFDPDSGPVDVDLGPLPESNYVSRHHAEIWKDGSGQWFIKDLGSRNGTFFKAPGEAQFQRATGDHGITSGSEIALGNARFEFQVK